LTIGVDNEITAADINAIITKINSEENDRVNLSDEGDQTDIASINAGDQIAEGKHDGMRVRNDWIDAVHCYCESDGLIVTHSGGASISPTAPDVATGEQIDETGTTDWSALETDADALIAQCDCDGNICLCEVNQTFTCTCNIDCGCAGDCGCIGDITLK